MFNFQFSQLRCPATYALIQLNIHFESVVRKLDVLSHYSTFLFEISRSKKNPFLKKQLTSHLNREWFIQKRKLRET